MKIALYVASWPPQEDANGITTYIANIAPALREAGHDVFILTHGSSEEHTIDVDCFVETPSLQQKVLQRFFPMLAGVRARGKAIANAVRYLVETKGIEILEIEESFGLSRAISTLQLLPVLVRLHGPWFLNANGSDQAKDKLRRYWEGNAIKRAAYVTAPSKYILYQTIDHYNLGRDTKYSLPVAFIANPISVQRREWSIDRCTRKQFLFVGRFDSIKGGDLVLKAFAEVAEKDNQATLVFVGPDRGIAGKRFFEFVQSELSPDVGTRARYLGLLPRDQIDLLRLESFATIFASRFEVFGYTILEAMALGCPIIAAAAGGATEMIAHREQGLLFEPGSCNDLANHMLELMRNRELACKLAEGARRKASIYAPEIAASRTAECYKEAVIRFRAPLR